MKLEIAGTGTELRAIRAALLAAVFSTALGYGTLIPLLPVYLAASGRDAAWHMGALPAVFLAAASVCAPLWGRLSDRLPRVGVLMAGLAGTAAAPAPFLAQHSLQTLYVYQMLSGAAFGAVTTVALAMLYEIAPPGGEARGVAGFGAASLAGYLAGPALGGTVAAMAGQMPGHRVVWIALAAQVTLVSAVLLLVALTRQDGLRVPFRGASGSAVAKRRTLAVLAAALLTAFMIGAFEIAASLYVRSPLHLGPRELALIFVACSGAMIVAQLAVLPRLAAGGRRLQLALGCIAASGVLVAALAWLQAHAAVVALGALQGVALGLAAGLVNFEGAATGGRARGVLLGYQNAAVNAGQAAGSAAGAAAFVTLGPAALPALGALVVFLAALLGRAEPA
jgi:predicted MFS family arabinose efflux permease